MAKQNKNKAKKISVALELHNDFVKIVAVYFTKQGSSVRLFKKDFFSKESDSVSRELANIFRIHKLPTTRIFLNIPRHFVMTRMLSLPSVKDEEIKNMVSMEAARQMPYRDEDIIAGYKVLDKKKDGYADILLAIVQASSIKRFINILKSASLSLRRIALSSESLLNWYSLAGYKKEKEAEQSLAIGLININSTYIDIDMIEKGRLTFTRAFSYLTKDLCAEDTIGEIRRSIDTFQRERKTGMGKLYVTGPSLLTDKIALALKREIDLPIELIDQFEGIKIEDDHGVDSGNASFAGLIGLATKGAEMDINLLPESMIIEDQMVVLKKELFTSFVLILCMILGLAGIAAKKIYDKSLYVKLLNEKIDLMEPKVRKARKMRDDIRIIKDVIQKKPLAIDVLSEIYKVTPESINYNLMDYEVDRSLTLRGNASSLDNVIKFMSVLENSGYFENVKIKYTAKRTVGGKQVTDFEIAASLNKAD